jgi:hypothetical protein
VRADQQLSLTIRELFDRVGFPHFLEERFGHGRLGLVRARSRDTVSILAKVCIAAKYLFRRD